MAVSTIVLFALGVEVQDSQARNAGTLVYAALMGSMAAGMWLSRYWAVLGFQTLLALADRDLVAAADQGRDDPRGRAGAGHHRAAGTMFWFLVKALARIQMPERRPRA